MLTRLIHLLAVSASVLACSAGNDETQALFGPEPGGAGGWGGHAGTPAGGSAGQSAQGGSGNADSGTAGSGGSATAATCAADAASFAQFRAELESKLKANGVVGAAVAVVCGNETVFTAGIGKVSKGGAEVGIHTRFQIASLTKTMTAALGMRLAEQGKVSLDESISSWVPFVNTSSPYSNPFTFGQLLSHSSGYPASVKTANYNSLETSFKNNGQLALWSPPGVVFNYSNDGYALAGLVLQKAGGASFGALVEAEVFQNAGMADARMDAAKVQSEGDYAVGYSTWDGLSYGPTDGYLAMPYYGPMGGAWASAEDLAHCAQAMLKGGGSLMSPASVTRMTTGHIETSWPGRKYGHGILIDDLGDTTLWSHSGSVGGFLCELNMVPERGFAVAIMVNTDGYFPYVIDEAVQRFTGKPLPYGSYDGSFHDTDMADHVGTYQSVTLGQVVVSKSGGQMQITLNGKTKLMTPEYRDTYSFPYDQYGDLEVTFWRVAGEVRYLVSGEGVGEKAK
jgi:CubicO group peptidase (beta-lactamase class C family)